MARPKVGPTGVGGAQLELEAQLDEGGDEASHLGAAGNGGTADNSGLRVKMTEQAGRRADEDGFVPLAVTQEDNPIPWFLLENLLVTEGSELGQGRDSRGSPRSVRSRPSNPECQVR